MYSKILRPEIGITRLFRSRVLLVVQTKSRERCTRSSIVAVGGSDCYRSCKTISEASSCFPQRIRSFCTRHSKQVTTAGRTAVSARSYHHRAAGYLAGVHSYRPQEGQQQATETTDEPPDFESFESAWEALQSVPTELLNDFEEEFWETQSRKFVYGTKHVSVVDAHEVEHLPNNTEENENDTQETTNQASGTDNNGGNEYQNNNNSRVFRYLILNERPNKIQTVVEVPFVGAPYHHYRRSFRPDENGLDGPSDAKHPAWIPNPPSPISQTHQGGLAMTLPFWYKANGIANGEGSTKSGDDKTTLQEKNCTFHHPPNCLLIGAGGCSLAHSLSASLFLDARPQRGAAESDPKPVLKAVEASLEILEASKLWFGASNEEEETTTSHRGSTQQHTKPPFFDLVHDTGESYLESLLAASRKGTRKKDQNQNDNTKPPSSNSSNQSSLLIDVLIIDAEDGSAPPQSMRTREFWNELVLPCLNFEAGPVVGVNAIGSHSETSALVQTMREAFRKYTNNESSSYNYTVVVVTPPPEANVTDRHKLVFALPSTKQGMTTSNNQTTTAACWNLADDDLNGLVDAPRAWEQQVKLALEDALDET